MGKPDQEAMTEHAPVTEEHRKLANSITTATNVYGSERGDQLLADALTKVRRETQPKPENMKWLLDAANQVINELKKQEHLDSETFRWLCNAVREVERDLSRNARAAKESKP